jgi:hypothetical protein
VSHPCPIDNCTTPAKDGQLMCLAHWRRVPKALNHAVFDTYRNIRNDQAAYRQARDEAIRVVNEKVKADG